MKNHTDDEISDDILYELSPNVDIGFHHDQLLLSTGANPAIVFENKQEQHLIADFCIALGKPKTKGEIISLFGADLFEKFLAWNFLITAYAFDHKDRNSRNLLFYNLTHTDPHLIHERLRNKHVTLIGCGGIGNNIASHLVNAGIGKLTLVDNDVVEASNLTRQIMFTMNDIDTQHKTDALAQALKNRTQQTLIETLPLFITSENVDQLPDCDFIAIAADSRYICSDINRYCLEKQTPFVRAAYNAQDAWFGPMVIPNKTACYECFAKRYIWSAATQNEGLQEKIQQVTARRFAPSISPVVAISAAMASLDILRYLGEFGDIRSKECAINLNTQTLQWTFKNVESMEGCSCKPTSKG